MATIVQGMALKNDTLGHSELSDSLLLEALRRGDRTAFDGLFLRHYPRVFGVLLRLVRRPEEAEDIAQDVFVKLAQHPPSEKREHNIAAWLYRVAVNSGRNALRAEQRQVVHRHRAVALDSPPLESDPVVTAIVGEQQELVRSVLSKLPEKHQVALALRYEGFSYQEIAAVLGVAVNAVGVTLARAERQFRDRYLQESNEAE